MINWATIKTSRKDMNTIRKIAERAEKFTKWPSWDTAMTLQCAHAECPIRLNDLLAAKDRDFTHEIIEIDAHLNRTTGKLTGGYIPRYARQNEPETTDEKGKNHATTGLTR